MEPYKGMYGRDLMSRAKCYAGSKPVITILFNPRSLVLSLKYFPQFPLY